MELYCPHIFLSWGLGAFSFAQPFWKGLVWVAGLDGGTPVTLSAAPTSPDVTLAGGAEQHRGSCVAVVFYDPYLDESQLHSGFMLVIVSTELDLLSLPPFSH